MIDARGLSNREHRRGWRSPGDLIFSGALEAYPVPVFLAIFLAVSHPASVRLRTLDGEVRAEFLLPEHREAVMEPTSRRDFLKHGSAAVAAAGVVIAVPASAAQAVTGDRRDDGKTRLPDGAQLDAPVVAHVRDLRKGEVVVFAGEQEITVRDKRLAALLYHATR